MFHVSVLRRYIFDPSHIIEFALLEISEDLSYEELPIRILATEQRTLRNQVISYVKILWDNHKEREATYELEESMRQTYPFLFET